MWFYITRQCIEIVLKYPSNTSTKIDDCGIGFSNLAKILNNLSFVPIYRVTSASFLKTLLMLRISQSVYETFEIILLINFLLYPTRIV